MGRSEKEKKRAQQAIETDLTCLIAFKVADT